MWYETESRQLPANENERPGTVASFACHSAFILAGSSSATCNSDGSWTFLNGAPVCISKVFTNYSGFSQIDKIRNNHNIGIRVFTT